MLAPEIEKTPGFVDSAHYSSLTRDGWVLSLSGWHDAASAEGWHAGLPSGAAGGRAAFPDYRLRVGEVTSDTGAPDGQMHLAAADNDKRDGEGTYVTLIDAKQTLEWISANNPQEIALYLGFDLYSFGDCISWDIFNSLSNPGEIILLVTWKDAQSANDHAATQIVPDDARVRVLRIIRDEAMPEGLESAQSHPASRPVPTRA
jgi:hypothetical protein